MATTSRVVPTLLMGVQDAAKAVGVSARTVRNWRALGLRSYKIGGRVLYKPADLERFADKHLVKAVR